MNPGDAGKSDARWRVRNGLRRYRMSSRYIGKKRDTGRDAEVPAELSRREAQDRAKGERGQARSPIDAQHVEAPKRRDNKRGHREENHG